MTTYCLICSAARSGSTLLDLMLGGHSRAASLGEFTFLGKALALDQQCSCGQRVSRCPHWLEVIDNVRRERQVDLLTAPYALRLWDARASVIVDRRHQTPLYSLGTRLRSARCDLRYRYGRRLPLPEPLQRALEDTVYLYETIARTWDRGVLIDSSKNVHQALAMHERHPEKTRVVFLTRDGRGVYHSRRSSGFSQRQSALGWYRYNRRAAALLEANLDPHHLARVRYEDLVADPEAVMRRLSRFLELDFQTAMMAPDPEHQHIVNGNDMRHRRGQTLRADQRWIEALTDRDLQQFNRLTGSMNERLGYH